MSLFVAALFVVLTPGVLVTLPSKGSKLTVAVVHGLLFAVVYHLTRKVVSHFLFSNGLSSTREAFEADPMDTCKEGASIAEASKISAKAVNDMLAARGNNQNHPDVIRLGKIALADLTALKIAKDSCKEAFNNAKAGY